MFEVEQTKTCNASGLVTYYIFCMMECSFISNQQVCFFSIGIMVMLLCVITLLMLYLFLRSLPSVSFSFFSSLSLGRFCGHFITLFLKKKNLWDKTSPFLLTPSWDSEKMGCISEYYVCSNYIIRLPRFYILINHAMVFEKKLFYT